MKQNHYIGTITSTGCVQLSDGKTFELPIRGEDEEGYPEVLIDARAVGGCGWMQRQSIKNYIGMKCKFIVNEGTIGGYNYTVVVDC